MRSKIDYCCQLYNTASTEILKKIDSIHEECTGIYTGAFTTSPVESLHIEAYDPLLELRLNELKLKFLNKLRRNTAYTESLNTLNDRGQKLLYKINEQPD